MIRPLNCLLLLLYQYFLILFAQVGDTALHVALVRNQLAVAKLLLELTTREAALSLNQVSSSWLGAYCMYTKGEQ